MRTTAKSGLVLLCFILHICIEECSSSSSLKLFEFPHGNVELSSSAYLAESVEIPAMTEITVCYRIKIYGFISTLYWFSVADYSPANSCCEMRILWTIKGPVIILRNKFIAISDVEVNLMEWYHHCFTFDYRTSYYTMFLNGQQISKGYYPDSLENLHPNYTLALATFEEDIKRCHDQTDYNNCGDQLSGMLTDFNIWSETMTPSFLVDFTTCQVPGNGNIVEWKMEDWIKIRVIEHEASLSDLCNERNDGFIVFPEPRDYWSSVRFCLSWNAELAAPKTLKENENLYRVVSFYMENVPKCSRFAIGWTDEFTEGTFINANEFEKSGGTEILKLPEEMNALWGPGEPNGRTLESCAEIPYRKGWNDLPCSESVKSCTACFFARKPQLILRGLCKGSNFDSRYILTKPENSNKPMMRGYYSSTIEWIGNETSGNWILKEHKSNEIAKLMAKSPKIYPIGRKYWTFFNDACLFGETRNVQLTLTVCNRSSFTCDSGECIPLENRCDNSKECTDGSDEVHCSILHIPEGYRKASLPPPSLRGSGPIIIRMEILIISLSDIDVNTGKMAIDFVMTLSWLDPRLQFYNLKKLFMNRIGLEEIKLLWVPEIRFTNTANNEISLVDESTETFVNKTGAGHEKDIDESVETMVYEGHDNTIVLIRKYTINFACNLELHSYPFDTQNCEMNFKLRNLERETAKIILTNLTYISRFDLLEYKVIDLSPETEYSCGSDVNISCSRVRIKLQRRVGSHLLNTYMPTGCILVIIYLTHYFDHAHYDTRIMVGLTGMLVLASLFISTSSTLPKTSYMKMMDIWMIFCFLLPFFEVIIHVFMEFLTNDRNKWKVSGNQVGPARKSALQINQMMKTTENLNRSKRRIDYSARILIPIIIISFNIFYWYKALKDGGISL